jgi:hypothetical protein
LLADDEACELKLVRVDHDLAWPADRESVHGSRSKVRHPMHALNSGVTKDRAHQYGLGLRADDFHHREVEHALSIAERGSPGWSWQPRGLLGCLLMEVPPPRPQAGSDLRQRRLLAGGPGFCYPARPATGPYLPGGIVVPGARMLGRCDDVQLRFAAGGADVIAGAVGAALAVVAVGRLELFAGRRILDEIGSVKRLVEARDLR